MCVKKETGKAFTYWGGFSQVQEFIREVQSSGGAVLAKDANMLSQNGEYLNLTSDWVKRLLSRVGLVKRKATTTMKITAEVFEDLKVQFFY